MIVRTWQLDLDADATLHPPRKPAPDPAVLLLIRDPAPEFARFLYEAVGRDCCWCSRLAWSDAHWREHYADPFHELWVASRHGGPVGFAELLGRDLDGGADSEVRISYLGLLPSHRDDGLGGGLVYDAATQARAMPSRVSEMKPVSRVRLDTRNLDGPRTRPNVLGRGFTETGSTRIVRPRAWFTVRRAVALGRRMRSAEPRPVPVPLVPAPRGEPGAVEVPEQTG